MTNIYLIKALRAYRLKVQGQFGTESEHIVQETQDAATEIERLNELVAKYEKGILVSFDGTNKEQGLMSSISWRSLQALLQKAYCKGDDEIVTLIANTRGVDIVFR